MLPQDYKQIIHRVLGPFKPTLVGIFGSYSRNEATKESDLDLLVDFEKRVNLFQLMDMEETLSQQLGVKVDLVTRRSLHPGLAPYVLSELKPL